MRDPSPDPVDSTVNDNDTPGRSRWTAKALVRQAEKSHRRLPGIRKIPLPAIGIILFIAFLNVVVWIAAAIVLRYHPSLVSNAVLSYTLGLRHAFDADHISAIDLMTRRLLATGQKPVTVGTFFSLGHSTIVIITSIVVAATAAAISSRFDSFSTIGGIIGTSVSAAFLILLGLMNAYILYKLYRQMQKVLNLPEDREDEIWKIEGGGMLFNVLKRMFKLIDRPWKMYPLGVLFGLGFDTSSEIALLGISSVEAAKGTNFWVILIFPALFTAGMCLLDTTDGALMLSLYVQPSANFLPPKSDAASDAPLISGPEEHDAEQQQKNHRDPVAFLYYSIVLTCLTVVVAIVIGVIQVLTLVLNVANPTGRFWDGVQVAGDYYDAIGGGICGRWVARRKGRGLLGEMPDPLRHKLMPEAEDLTDTHLTIESLHDIEEELVRRNARLTYDIDEAALILGKLSQPKRAALELRTLGVWTEPAQGSSKPPPAKRRRGNAYASAPGEAEVIDLSTETEDEEDGMSSHASSTHLHAPAKPTPDTSTLTVVKLEWLHACLRTNTILPTEEYTVYHARRIERPAHRSPPPTKQTQTSILARAKADASMQPPAPQRTRPYQPRHHQQQHHPRTQPPATSHPPKLHRTTTSEAEDLGNLPPPPSWITAPHNTYACLRSTPLHPPNEAFINELLTIRHIRELTLDEIGVRAYSTAIASLAAYPYPLRRPAEVAALPGCDAKIANLFYEFQQLSPSSNSSGENTPRPPDPSPANLGQDTPGAPQPQGGRLTATHPLTHDPTLATLHTFYNIWGVGAKTAREFYFQRGWRSLDDIIEYGWDSLSRVQQIGVKFYDEFQEGIPREEVEGIAAVVRRHANAVIDLRKQQQRSHRHPTTITTHSDNKDEGGGGVECIITGSHRRGKPFSGDVDLILTHRDEDATKNLIGAVLRSLEAEGWITHTLALHQGHSAREQATIPYRADNAVGRKMFDSLDKGLVVWQHPDPRPEGGDAHSTGYTLENGKGNPHRRVDIIISPWRTVGCAVLGWSGDKTFERDLRRFVKKERGWKFDSSGVRERGGGGLVVDLEGAGETWEERERLVMEGLGIGFRGPGERCTR
ncbi:NicO-domain-containing protein [Aspergillus brunneoviolaceus CBS 621.78]|uniref:NicO-domain-containing protein n=1 Tax=Aspergillus brunneoviolaceus CBS 621.78 TaxID=1450534 RepID=A0ACD1FXM4_9EURO|nr:NicO-domain-containing protein [Aspergillus brunneoviolaceus CBS 621.78]RAH41719.1 NicO-domain-containing protein [Aspergillus brunneoviolaceus CBS 621.78]